MKRKWLQLAGVLLASMLVAAPIAAYDSAEAEGYAQMFATVQGPQAGKHLHLISPEQFVNEVRAGKQYVTLDIRTPGETRFFTGNLPGHLVIPLNELFKPDQLAKLPQDAPIVVMCASGVRATAATTALRDIGFEQTYVLKGGFKGLVTYLGAKEANQPLGPQTAAR
ncbi:MAG: rhodanese-like domain-containing protein [Chromatiaceae bacterium]|nr:rhodanese-like domain-containing protein [Chromatiaceae bacterium]